MASSRTSIVHGSFIENKLDTQPLTELDYYTLLSVQPSASSADIKAAYHHVLLSLHPDRNQTASRLSFQLDAPRASVDIGRIKDAYRTLSDPVLRESYDAALRFQKGEGVAGKPRPAQVVSLEEFMEGGSEGWAHACRCGGVYRIGEVEMERGQHLVGCGSCSEVIWVGYEVIESGDEESIT